jgi:hypothetical protein
MRATIRSPWTITAEDARDWAPGCSTPSGASGARATPDHASSALGGYQFRSPSSFGDAGRRTARTMVASIRIAAQNDAPLDVQRREGPEDREDAAHDERGVVTTAAVAVIPVGPPRRSEDWRRLPRARD